MAKLEIKWLPAVGAARYEVREQGPGNTPIERFQNGVPLGPRVDSTRFVFTAAELRPYNISVRAYNRSGVASREPTELTVVTNLRVEGSRIPSDIDLLMYISWDEHTDQNGDILEPTLWKDGLTSDPDVAPVGSAERRRRLRWDQGRTGNTMWLEFGDGGPFSNGGFTVVLPTAEKSGPCNHHIQMGDADSGTAAGRKQLFFSFIGAIVDRRADAAVNGQTEMDLTDSVTYIQWINPVLMWERGDTFGQNNGQIHQLWSRLDNIVAEDFGYVWGLGGPPWWDGGSNTNIHKNPGVNGFTFLYLPVGGTTIGGDGNALFWPYPWEQGKNSSPGGDGWPVDAGEYCGWLFCALTISPTDAAGNCEFTQWVGQADQDNLVSLGTQVATAPFGNWGRAGAGLHDPASVMTAINHMFSMVLTTDGWYEDQLQLGHFAKYDESRIYARTLSDAEVRGLYNHPGGQKRTENLIEPLRQVFVP